MDRDNNTQLGETRTGTPLYRAFLQSSAPASFGVDARPVSSITRANRNTPNVLIDPSVYLMTDAEREASDRSLREIEARIRTGQMWLEEEIQSNSTTFYEEFRQVKVTYTTANGRLTFEQDGLDRKAAFEFVGAVQELFEEPDCGCCKSTKIQCRVQEHDSNKYYKLVCSDCGAQIDFGQRKDGKGMWLKRTDKDTGTLPNRGWYVWQGNRRSADTTQTSGYQPEQQGPYGSEVPF